MRYLRQLSKGVWIANLAIVTVLGYIMISFWAQEHPGHETVATPPQQTEENRGLSFFRGEPRDRIDDKLILERNIFALGSNDGIATALAQEKTGLQQPATAAKRELRVRLLGTVVGDEQVPCAVLEDLGSKTQDIYRVGGNVQGARIESIEQNKVVLLVEGTREVLNLSLTTQESIPNRGAVVPTVAKQVDAGEVVRIVSDTERQVNTRASQSGANRVAEALKNMKLVPHVVNGKADGLRVAGLEDSPLARIVGLKDGDVVQSINGHQVPDQRKAFQVLQKARRLDAAQIQLMRGKEKKTLAFKSGSW
jgi:type II secretion system protein C